MASATPHFEVATVDRTAGAETRERRASRASRSATVDAALAIAIVVIALGSLWLVAPREWLAAVIAGG